MNEKKDWLYLDDNRIPDDARFDIVRNLSEFTKYIREYVSEKSKLPDMISFDHDLADEHMKYYFDNPKGAKIEYLAFREYTGMHCAKWLTEFAEENKLVINKTCVHSHNPVGANNIQHWINLHHKRFDEKQDCFLHKWPHKYIENKCK